MSPAYFANIVCPLGVRRARVGVGEGGAGEDFNLISIANNDFCGFSCWGALLLPPRYTDLLMTAQYVHRASQAKHRLN